MHFYSAVPASGSGSWIPDLHKLPQKIRDRLFQDKSLFGEFVDDVEAADYVDMDYDTTTQAIVFTFQSTKNGTDITYLPDKQSTVEIGVLSHELNSDPEDIQFGGFLTVLGRDNTPSKSTYLTNIANWS